MGLNQTSSQQGDKIRIGSVKMLYTLDDFNTFVDVGLGVDFGYTENATPLDVNPDNGTEPDELAGFASQTVNVTGSLLAFNLTTIEALRGGLDVKETVPSTPVAGATKALLSGEWTFDSAILLEQNQDGTAQTINSVTGSVDGVGAADDWTQVKIGSYWYLVPKDGTNFTTEAQDLTINYDYTPAASTTLYTGGLSAITRFGIRLYNRVAGTATAAEAAANAGISEGDAIYRTVRWDFYKGGPAAGETMSFVNKDETDPTSKLAVDILFKTDPERAPGYQLFSRTELIELQSAVTI